MKRIMNIFIVTVVGLSLTIAGIAFAQGWSNSRGKGDRGPWQGRGMGPGYSQYHRGMGPGPAQQYRRPGPGYFRFQHGLGPGVLLRDEMHKAQVEVLAELSGQAVKEIQEQMKTKSFWMLFDEYQVNPEEFHTTMNAKMILLVDQAVKAGKITEGQAKSIYERINWMSQHSFANGPCWGTGFRK